MATKKTANPNKPIAKKPKKQITKSKPGAPTKYKPEYDNQAYKLCLLGSTDKQLADFFDVCEDTINEWKIVYPAFSVSIKEGKTIADANIAEGLYNRANGMIITKQTAIKLTTKEPVLDATGEPTRIMRQTERIEIVDLMEQVPPETTAGIIWLKNRRPQNWKDKQVIEQSGLDGGPIVTTAQLSINIMSTATGISATEREIQDEVNRELGIEDENQ